MDPNERKRDQLQKSNATKEVYKGIGGKVTRAILPDGGKRITIAPQDKKLETVIVANSDARKAVLGKQVWGIISRTNWPRTGQNTTIQVIQPNPNVQEFLFMLGDQRVGMAKGADFDLALARGLGISGQDLDKAAEGSRLDQQAIEFLRYGPPDQKPVNPLHNPTVFLRRLR